MLGREIAAREPPVTDGPVLASAHGEQQNAYSVHRHHQRDQVCHGGSRKNAALHRRVRAQDTRGAGRVPSGDRVASDEENDQTCLCNSGSRKLATAGVANCRTIYSHSACDIVGAGSF